MLTITHSKFAQVLPLAFLIAFAIAESPVLTAAALTPVSVTVGQNLETTATVQLPQPAPKEGVQITVRSDDPRRLLLSKSPEREGTAELLLTVSGGQNMTQEFYIQALAKDGAATYTASSPSFESGKGTATLMPSAILIAGQSRVVTSVKTTPHGWPSKLTIYSARLDASGNFSAVQAVRGGYEAKVNVASSNTACGAPSPASLTIKGGNVTEPAQFLPSGLGETTISLDVPAGFSKAAPQFMAIQASVSPARMAVTDLVPIGRNLELGGSVLLGELAPPGGLRVTLTTGDPTKLLLSIGANDPGTKSITVSVAGGGANTPYFLQALGDSGNVTYTATAPGFQDAKGTVHLRPSGVLISGPTGPPDEAEVLRPNIPLGPNGLYASLASHLAAHRPPLIVIYTANLDPVTHRCADITVQPLRGGLSLRVALKNSDPAVGTIAESVTIPGGTSQGITEFLPVKLGTTMLSVVTPEGYTTPTNATTLTAIVRE